MAFWLFQGNPQYYRVLDAIKELEQIPWLVTRYANVHAKYISYSSYSG